jgi:hypothetical protein
MDNVGDASLEAPVASVVLLAAVRRADNGLTCGSVVRRAFVERDVVVYESVEWQPLADERSALLSRVSLTLRDPGRSVAIQPWEPRPVEHLASLANR